MVAKINFAHRLAVISLGYVDLLTAVIFASRGLGVIGVDMGEKKVETVNSGRCYIREPGLDNLLRNVVSKGFLRATTDTVGTVRKSDAVLIPVMEGVTDLSYLKEVLEAVRRDLHRELPVIIESTIPPGTTASFAKPPFEETGLKSRTSYSVHVPERIMPELLLKSLTYYEGRISCRC